MTIDVADGSHVWWSEPRTLCFRSVRKVVVN